jgi:putative ABC transport system permease protein
VREFKARRTAALVGRATMQRFGWKVGDQVSLRGTLYPFNLTFDIVGTIDRNAPPNVLIFRRDYLEEAAGRPGFVSLYWVRTDNSAAVPQVIAAIDEAFANSSAETQSQSEAAFIGGFLENYRTIFLIAELLGVIVVLTIALVAANTAAMSIRERRAEIAVMRAMGFPASTVLGLLLAESITISLVGGALGCGAAWAAMRMFSVGAPAMGPLSTVRVPAEVVLIGLAIAALIGIFSALIPARSAARRNIVDTLRAVA